MSRNELILLLLEQMDRNIIYNIDITKDKVTIYLVNDYFKTIKFNVLWLCLVAEKQA